ncbi:callose synthase 3, partial [Phtheirospermum japonicum]
IFNQAFSRGLQILRILGGHRKDRSSRNKEWFLCVLSKCIFFLNLSLIIKPL